MLNKIKILIADDHQLIRKGLYNLLSGNEEIEIVGEAHNGEQAVNMAMVLLPHVLIMDLSMPVMNGIEASRKIKSRIPELPIMILTMHSEAAYIKAALEAGVSGYLLKNLSAVELVKAIVILANGGTYFSYDVTQKAMQFMVKKNAQTEIVDPDRLSDREKEVLELILKQHSNQEIADKLFISTKTVESHKRNLIEKTGSKNIVGLIIYAINNKI